MQARAVIWGVTSLRVTFKAPGLDEVTAKGGVRVDRGHAAESVSPVSSDEAASKRRDTAELHLAPVQKKPHSFLVPPSLPKCHRIRMTVTLVGLQLTGTLLSRHACVTALVKRSDNSSDLVLFLTMKLAVNSRHQVR